jgi:tetratricopeptide (TPR) repeat protein
LIGLGEAHRQLGEPEFRDRLVEASKLARDLRDLDRLSRAVLANTLGPFGAVGPRDAERVELLEWALLTLPDDWPQRARAMAILAKELYYSGDPDGGSELCEQAERLAPQSDERERARVLAFTTTISRIEPPDEPTPADDLFDATLDAYVERVDQLRDLARGLGDPELSFRAANAQFTLGMHTGERDRLDQGLAGMRDLADRIEHPTMLWHTLWAEGARETINGDLEEAEECTRRACELGLEHAIDGVEKIWFGQRLAIYGEQGRLGDLEETAKLAARNAPHLPILQLAPAFIAAETGRPEEAKPILDRFAAAGFAFPYDRTRAFDLARCADIALRVGALDHAETLYDLLWPRRGRFATVSAISSRGSVHLVLGRLAGALGRGKAVEDHFTAAEDAHSRLGAPRMLARTHLAWGEALLQSDPSRARGLLRKAESLAREHGGDAVVREAESLLRRVPEVAVRSAE